MTLDEYIHYYKEASASSWRILQKKEKDEARAKDPEDKAYFRHSADMTRLLWSQRKETLEVLKDLKAQQI